MSDAVADASAPATDGEHGADRLLQRRPVRVLAAGSYRLEVDVVSEQLGTYAVAVAPV